MYFKICRMRLKEHNRKEERIKSVKNAFAGLLTNSNHTITLYLDRLESSPSKSQTAPKLRTPYSYNASASCQNQKTRNGLGVSNSYQELNSMKSHGIVIE